MSVPMPRNLGGGGLYDPVTGLYDSLGWIAKHELGIDVTKQESDGYYALRRRFGLTRDQLVELYRINDLTERKIDAFRKICNRLKVEIR